MDPINQCFEAGHVWARGLRPGLHFDFSPSAPPPRDAAAEGKAQLQAQIDLAPAQYAANAEYSPKYADLGRQNLDRFLLGNGDGTGGFLDTYTKKLAPAFTQANVDASRTTRAADIADVASMGAGAVEAFRSANPQQKALVDRLNVEANAGLDAGYNLPAGLRRVVTQSARAGQLDRGMGTGPSDAYAETLANSDAAAQYYGQNFNRAQQVVGINAATNGDPFQLVTGRASGAGGLSLAQFGQQGVAGSGAPNFDPFSAYGSDLANTNYNAQAAANIAGANNAAGMLGAGIGAVGKIGAGSSSC